MQRKDNEDASEFDGALPLIPSPSTYSEEADDSDPLELGVRIGRKSKATRTQQEVLPSQSSSGLPTSIEASEPPIKFLNPEDRALKELLEASEAVRDAGVFNQREVYQDASAELRALEQLRAARFTERYTIVQTWPDWRQRLHRMITRGTWFEACIFTVITINCVTISTDNIGSSDNNYAEVIKVIDDIIVWIYFAEMIVKMVALGVFVRRWGYFSSKWNIIDCIIALTGVIAFLIISTASADYVATTTSVARTLRVLRPFRMLTSLRMFRMVLRSIAAALIRLTHVLALSIVFVIVMGLIALHFFHGTISYRCHTVSFNPFTNETSYEMEDEAPACVGSYLPLPDVVADAPDLKELPWGPRCTGVGDWYTSPSGTTPFTVGSATSVANATTSAFTQTTTSSPSYNQGSSNCTLQGTYPFLTSDRFSANTSQVGNYFSAKYIALPFDGRPFYVHFDMSLLPAERTGVICPFSQLCLKGQNPNKNRDSFDNLYQAFLLLYSILCMEAWSSIMYYVVDAKGLPSEIYFAVVVVVGAVVILNLALTIITDAFSRSVAMEEELDQRQKLVGLRDKEEARRAQEELALGRQELSRTTNKVVEALKETPGEKEVLYFSLKERLYQIMRTKGYIYFLSFISLLNLALLASYTSNMTHTHDKLVSALCPALSCIFLADGAIFAFSSPVRRTFRSPTTLFRLAVGVMAVVEWFLWDSGAISAFFAVRTLQPMRRFRSLRVTFAYLYKALKASFTLIALLLVVIFLFAIIGMQLFAGKLCDMDDSSLQTSTPFCGGVPRTNFDHVGYGIVTVFIIVVGDSWRDIMNDALSRVNEATALYFCLCYLIGGYLIVNLFVAVLFSYSDNDEDLGVDEDDVSTFKGGSLFDASSEGGELEDSRSVASSRHRSQSFVQSMIVDRQVKNKEPGHRGRRPSYSTPFISLQDDEGETVELKELRRGSSSNDLSGSNRQKQSQAQQPGTAAASSNKDMGKAGSFRNLHRSRFKNTPVMDPPPPGGNTRLRGVSVLDPQTQTISIPGEEDDPLAQSFRGASGPASVASFSSSSKKWGNKTVMNSMRGRQEEGLLGSNAKINRWRNDNDSLSAIQSGTYSLDGDPANAPNLNTMPGQGLLSEFRFTMATEVLTSDEDEDEEEGAIDETWDDLGDFFTPMPRRKRKRNKEGSNDASSPSGVAAASALIGAKAVAAQEKVMQALSAMEQFTAFGLKKDEVAAAQMSSSKHLNIISRLCGTIVTSRVFSWLMLTVILFSMISLALVDPLTYPDSSWNTFTVWSDLICGILFFIEFVLKLGYLGVYSKDSTAARGYFNSAGNAFDFCLMLVGIVPAANMFYSDPAFNDAADFLRVVRALRPFSFIGRHSGLELIFRSLIFSLPAIGNISVIVLLVWMVFSAAATQLFGGKLWACTSEDWGDMSYNAPNIRTQAECTAAGYQWTNFESNFDNFGNSLLAMFRIASCDNWHNIMFAATDAVGWGEAPRSSHKAYLAVFFIAFIVLESFFLINFFVSVMVDTYFITKARMELEMRERYASDILSEDQLDFVNMYRRALIFVKPPIHISMQNGSVRLILRRIARSRLFELSYLLFALLQTCLEATQHMEYPPIDYDTLLHIDLAFTIIFWLFVAIKMSVLGIGSFFEQNTRRTEVLINLVTTAGVVGELATGEWEGTTILRLCRVVRLYRCIYLDAEMRLLVDTITVSMPSIIKVFFILLMTFYLFAVIGMGLFGRVKWEVNKKDGLIGNYANFQRLDSAFMVMLRVATLDDWAELMKSCSLQPPDCDPEIGNCGMPVVGPIYFCLLVLILQWIGLNFFTAALMDAFKNAEKDERYALQKPHIDDFRRRWKEVVDLDTTMPLLKVQQFIARLGRPLGPDFASLHHAQLAVAQERLNPKKDDPEAIAELQRLSVPPAPSFHRVLAFLTRLRLPMYEGTHVSQADLFDALVRYYYGVPLPQTIDEQLSRLIKRRFEVGQFQRHVAAANDEHNRIPMQLVAAAALIQARYRGMRVRRIVQQTLEEHRARMAAEGLSMAHVQQSKRDRVKRERLLARPIGSEVL